MEQRHRGIKMRPSTLTDQVQFTSRFQTLASKEETRNQRFDEPKTSKWSEREREMEEPFQIRSLLDGRFWNVPKCRSCLLSVPRGKYNTTTKSGTRKHDRGINYTPTNSTRTECELSPFLFQCFERVFFFPTRRMERTKKGMEQARD